MFRTPKTIEMQNTTLCLISLNNACCCSDSSFLIHQNPLSHYSVIFDFSFDCLPVQFSRCAEGSYSRIFDSHESYPLFRSFKTIQCVNQQSNRMLSSFPISRFRRQRFGYFVSCGSYRYFLHLRFHADARPWNPNASFSIRVSLERR